MAQPAAVPVPAALARHFGTADAARHSPPQMAPISTDYHTLAIIRIIISVVAVAAHESSISLLPSFRLFQSIIVTLVECGFSQIRAQLLRSNAGAVPHNGICPGTNRAGFIFSASPTGERHGLPPRLQPVLPFCIHESSRRHAGRSFLYGIDGIRPSAGATHMLLHTRQMKLTKAGHRVSGFARDGKGFTRSLRTAGR